MKVLKGEHIHLRALEAEDLIFLHKIENDEDFWEVSNTITPFSKFILKNYLENAHLDIYEAKQLRLVIARNDSDAPIGFIDLFDFDPFHKRAGIGIMIVQSEQNKGFATESLNLVINYSFTYLQLHQLYANITEDNQNSIFLFEKCNFKHTGTKKDWIYSVNNNFKDELLFQLISEKC
ncbi:GNAT family N-acetyltransferase [Aureivirga sp. CE67]|uniref:GNAT family N-acetyltransferase n=1 Tax=Aureivirga sp. CE67 TaxID=1788983 RepID=UPI0018C99E80|nr:GNAT family protein [Aureivirga sp. CE67]